MSLKKTPPSKNKKSGNTTKFFKKKIISQSKFQINIRFEENFKIFFIHSFRFPTKIQYHYLFLLLH